MTTFILWDQRFACDCSKYEYLRQDKGTPLRAWLDENDVTYTERLHVLSVEDKHRLKAHGYPIRKPNSQSHKTKMLLLDVFDPNHAVMLSLIFRLTPYPE